MRGATSEMASRPDGLLVGIHIEFETSYYRKVMVGIRRYLSLHPRIHSHIIQTLQSGGSVPETHRKQAFDGLIGLIMDRETGTIMRGLHPKVLSITSATPIRSMPLVSTHDHEVGRIASRHLIERGYRNLFFVGGAFAYGRLRLKGARELAAEYGLNVRWIPARGHKPGHFRMRSNPPYGIFCETDAMAGKVIKQLLESGYSVPEEAGVVGGDNDELACALSDIPISSVKLDEERVGFEAMRIMHEWILNTPPPDKPVLIDPVRLVARASSGVYPVRDERVKEWLTFLESHLGQVYSVKDLAAKLNLSRRVLERKFREELDCSVFGKITELRIKRANQLMRETNKSLSEISDQCGFGDPRTFSLTFKRIEGISPSLRRRQFQEHTRRDGAPGSEDFINGPA